MSERHFEFSATVIRQLGEQLISDEVTALMELVKNAYDADASYARIIVDTTKDYHEEALHFTRPDSGAAASGIPTGMPGAPGYIVIEDDGTGMNEADIERGWLVISLSSKRDMKLRGEVTPKYGRTPLGDKGLGRLSAQRLGSRLEMFTVKEHLPTDGQLGFFAKQQYHVAVDWDSFHEGTLLSEVPVFVDDSPRSNQTGTRLIISGLRNPGIWTESTARKGLVAQLTQLISPFARTRPFKVYLSVDNDHYDFGMIADRVRSVATATHQFGWDGKSLTVSGKVKLSTFRGKDRPEVYRHMLGNDQGEAFFAFLEAHESLIPNLQRESDAWFISYSTALDGASLGGLEYEDIPGATESSEIKRRVVDPGPFTGEIDQFIYKESEAAALGDVFSREATYKDYVRQHAGVRIYRDGFGIPPYGLGENDWLGLQHGQTSGGSFYGLRPRNVIGYVEISARKNARLIEKTDREGFSLDSASRNFLRLTAEMVGIINSTLETLRRDYNEYKKTRREELTGFASPGELFSAMRTTSSSARALQAPISHVQFERATQSMDTLLGQLHGGASRATPEAAELRDALQRAKTELLSAQETLRRLSEVQERTRELDHAADWLEQQFETLQHQLHEFSGLAGLGLTAEAVSHELVTWAERLGRETRALTETLRSRGTLVPEVTTYSAYIRSAITTLRRQLNHLDPSLRYARERVDTISTRAFFRSTADYYLRMRRVSEVGISIGLDESFEDFSFRMNQGKFTQVIDNLVLNSVYWLREGIRRADVENPTITFGSRRPFVTVADNGLGVDPAIEPQLFQPFVTTKPRGEGRGLGLFITQQLLDSVGCEISLDPQRNAHGRKYIFQLDLTGAIDGK